MTFFTKTVATYINELSISSFSVFWSHNKTVTKQCVIQRMNKRFLMDIPEQFLPKVGIKEWNCPNRLSIICRKLAFYTLIKYSHGMYLVSRSKLWYARKSSMNFLCQKDEKHIWQITADYLIYRFFLFGRGLWIMRID